MKLNPTKCTFGAEEGKFMGYYVTHKGIQPNPSKIKDLLETNPPKNLKKMQGLNGKITTLGHLEVIQEGHAIILDPERMCRQKQLQIDRRSRACIRVTKYSLPEAPNIGLPNTR